MSGYEAALAYFLLAVAFGLIVYNDQRLQKVEHRLDCLERPCEGGAP